MSLVCQISTEWVFQSTGRGNKNAVHQNSFVAVVYHMMTNLLTLSRNEMSHGKIGDWTRSVIDCTDCSGMRQRTLKSLQYVIFIWSCFRMVRELAAKCLHRLTAKAQEYMSKSGIISLLYFTCLLHILFIVILYSMELVRNELYALLYCWQSLVQMLHSDTLLLHFALCRAVWYSVLHDIIQLLTLHYILRYIRCFIFIIFCSHSISLIRFWHQTLLNC